MLNLAKKIVYEAKKKAQKYKADNVNSITIIFGELNPTSYNAFHFHINKLFHEDTFFNGTKINIQKESAQYYCHDCGYSGMPNQKEYKSNKLDLSELAIKCKTCKSMNTAIVSGNKVYIDNIDIV